MMSHICQQPYRAEKSSWKVLCEYMDKQLEFTIGDPGHSVWASHMNCSQKRKGIYWFCMIFRFLHAANTPYTHPLPHIDACNDIQKEDDDITALDALLNIGEW